MMLFGTAIPAPCANAGNLAEVIHNDGDVTTIRTDTEADFAAVNSARCCGLVPPLANLERTFG